jgi:hypothetical protein
MVPSTKLATETLKPTKQDKQKLMLIEPNVTPQLILELSRLARSGELARAENDKKVKR